METKNLIMTIVGVAVSVIIVAACLMPVLSDAVKTEDTFKNEGYYNLTKIDNTTESVLIWDSSNPTTITVDDVSVTLPSTGRLTLIASDKICMRYNATNQIQVYGSRSGTQDYKAISSGIMTATISGGNVAVKVGSESAKNFDLGDHAYLIAPDNVQSDYVAVMKLTTEKAHLLGDSEIELCGISISNNYHQSVGIFGRGTIDDGMTLSTLYVGDSYDSVTIGDTVGYYDVVTDHKNLYLLDKFTTTATYTTTGSDTPVDYAITYSYFIVPYEVTAERAVHFTPEQIAVFSAIPLLIIVAILLMAVSIINKGRE